MISFSPSLKNNYFKKHNFIYFFNEHDIFFDIIKIVVKAPKKNVILHPNLQWEFGVLWENSLFYP